MQFSTPNTDNDLSGGHCARIIKKSGFWFRDCTKANINGIYESTDGDGVNWRTWRVSDSLKKTMMKIKPTTEI